MLQPKHYFEKCDITIVSIKVFLTNATDRVLLKTDFPCPFTKEGLPSQPNLEVQFDATYDTGIDYVRDYFGMEPQVINLRS